MSRRELGALLAPLGSDSPVSSWRTDSISTSLQTMLSMSALRSLSSLMTLYYEAATPADHGMINMIIIILIIIITIIIIIIIIIVIVIIIIMFSQES